MKQLVLAVLLAVPGVAQVAAYRGFTLIDGNGGAPVSGAAMIVENGRITWVGPAAQLKAPQGVTVKDLSGKFVMPGIIDLHVHVSVGSGLDQVPKKYFTRENVEKNLKLYASYGVTTVVSMGTDQPLVYEIRQKQRDGRPMETRIFTAGRGFTGKGGFPTAFAGIEGVPYEVETPQQAVADVEELASHHPDLVKIWVDDRLGRDPKIRIALSAAIIQTAHKHGLKVAAHIFYLQDAKQLVAAGLDVLAHSVRDQPVDDELIRLMKQHGAWQIATLSREASTFAYGTPAPFLNDPFFMRAVSPDVLATLKSAEFQRKTASDPDFPKYPGFLETAKQNLKRLADAGVLYGFGTDAGPPLRFAGYSGHWEVQLMVEVGLTPMQVITAATKSSAAYLGASKDLGTIEKGKWADFLVLTANPLVNIRNTRTIEAVYIAGNQVN
jgi:imidazolonepropionase-like amidohydrolase